MQVEYLHLKQLRKEERILLQYNKLDNHIQKHMLWQ